MAFEVFRRQEGWPFIGLIETPFGPVSRVRVGESPSYVATHPIAATWTAVGSSGSFVMAVLEREQIMPKFHEVTARLEQALSSISYENLDMLDEVKEQVELVLAQFRRAKGRVDTPDFKLYGDLLSLSTRAMIQQQIQIQKIPTWKLRQEKKSSYSSSSGQTTTDRNHKTPVIPDDFRCPIYLELMKDPVIVSTGQKWLEQRHGTCLKAQQTLSNTALTPNYALRSLIDQWCEANGIEPPKRPGSSRPIETTSAFSPAERAMIEILLRKLTSSNLEDQRMAAGEIRLFTKRNADNRVSIAEAGAIPLLVSLLSTTDPHTQEHVVTALLNLSICEVNKGCIVTSGANPGIVQVLKKGSMEARENATATLFSLSIVDENKVAIGASGAIPPLVTMLSEGTVGK
ncbi:U-box domain-containing protein 13 [Hibiscus syriacus]|uniref:RING-type E3 ubiquitin transferase n=1 Tax=Hibiscus syriacus TaxID=106335 RepID=A0A6A2ZA57_HIBSY|nr:U-box domain-containing protein 13 [Hibiscus syriacus]